MVRTAAILSLFLLVACAAPTPFTLFTFAADGVSYVATGKAVTDHALSAAIGRDCAMHRVIQGQPVCGAAMPQVAAPVIHPGDRPVHWTGTAPAEFAGFAPATEFYALRHDDGAVEIFAHDPAGGDGVLRLVATIADVESLDAVPELRIKGVAVTVAELMV